MGIEYRSTDRLFIETHPDYAPVPIPYKYYQLVVADDKAVGWTGTLKASIPEATASIQAKVVAPLKCDPLRMNVAWEGETIANITAVTGGSGRYAVEAPKGVSSSVDNGALTVTVPGPGSYDLTVTDLCVHGEKQTVEVIHVEVAIPLYCTAEPSGSSGAIRIVPRGVHGTPLLAPTAVPTAAPLPIRTAKTQESVYGTELVIHGLDAAGMFITFQTTVSGVTVKDEVLVTGSDSKSDEILMSGLWCVCVDGSGWSAPGEVSVWAGGAASVAVAARDGSHRHLLRHDRTRATRLLRQLPALKMEFQAGEWPPTLVPLTVEASGLTGGPVLCTEEQKYALEGVQVELPFVCRTELPHIAEPVLDIMKGQIGCKIIPAIQITEASEVDLCAEWGVFRTCTKVLLLPPIQVTQSKVSLLSPPALFTVVGHPRALKLTKLTTSPGLKLDIEGKPGEIFVTVTNEASTCGLGWVTVYSKLTGQEIRVDVERECDVACGTLLGALLSLIRPYLSTIATIAAVAAAYFYVLSRMQYKSQIRSPIEPVQSVLPPSTPAPVRTRTWSRSPYAAAGPAVPVYGDTSVLPDTSFSPNSSRTHSRFL